MLLQWKALLPAFTTGLNGEPNKGHYHQPAVNDNG